MKVLANTDQGNVTLTVSDDRGRNLPFQVVGSSIRVSANQGEEICSLSFSAQPSDRQEVICLCVLGPGVVQQTILTPSITWKAGKVSVSEGRGSHCFVGVNPIQPYPGQLDKPAWIEAQICDDRYTTSFDRFEPGVHYVSDPDTICKYGTGELKADDVEAAALKTEEEASIREQLQSALTSLADECDKVAGCEARIVDLDEQIAGQKQDLDVLRAELKGVRKGRDEKETELKAVKASLHAVLLRLAPVMMGLSKSWKWWFFGPNEIKADLQILAERIIEVPKDHFTT